jgi:D-arabinose 1-dehydrogenase-like Zn-dependent alcohol dehydrogenase
VLGLNGVTAYFGLLDVGEPRPRDTLVVSTAAGAVGSAVGQIAKLMGCRTVGLTGGPIKCKLCRDEFGYDEVIDYKADSLATGHVHVVSMSISTTPRERLAMWFYRSSPLAPALSSAVPRRFQVGIRHRWDQELSDIFL